MSGECFGTIGVDITLRSVDEQEFRVHKNTFSITSPALRDIFTFLQPPSSEPLSIPVVDVYKSGRVRCVLPISPPGIEAGCRGSRVDAFSGKKKLSGGRGKRRILCKGYGRVTQKTHVGQDLFGFHGGLCESFAIA